MKRTTYGKYYLAAAIALATFAVYLSSFYNAFVDLDDPLYIVENPHIRSLNGDFFKWAFFDFYAANWHPLTWISHAVDYAVWGLDPSGHHLTNILLHSVNAFLVVLLAIKLMELARELREDPGPSEFFDTRAVLTAAGATGLLFGLHPLHVESAAWVSERKDVLCALFFLLSLMKYGDYVRSVHSEAPRGRPWPRFFHKQYALALGFFVIALLSKPMAVTLPVVLLILDWYPFNRIRSGAAFLSACAEKLPFFAFSLMSSVLTVLAQRSVGALQSLDVIPFSTRVLVAARALVLYLWKMIWPLDLVPYYTYPKNVSVLSPEYFLSILFLVAITAGCLFLAKKRKMWPAVWSYYIVTLVPVIGIVQVGSQPMADRYTYLPSLGPFFLAGLAVAGISGAERAAGRWRPGYLLFKSVAALLVLATMSSATAKQIEVWKTGMGLWDYIIDKKTEAPNIYYNRGLALYNLGLLDRALADDNMAIALNPSYCEAYSNRGQIFDRAGQFDKAISDYDKAIALNPTYFQAYYNRGVAYIKTKQFEKAIEDFTRTIEMNPTFLSSSINRGTAFFLSGQLGKAIADFDRVIALDPSNAQAYYNRGILFQKTGRLAEAERDFSRAKALRPVPNQ